jgi:hypothetical protein
MSNMSYCRFENTLGDLRDCHEQLKAMDGGDEFDAIPSHNTHERSARVRFCLEVLEAAQTIRDGLGLEPDDDGEVSRAAIEEWIAKCEARDEELRRNHEDEGGAS